MSDATFFTLDAAVLILLVAALVALRRGRAGRWAFVVGAAAAAVHALAVAAIVTDYRDADGFTDCHPACTTFQDAVAIGFWYGSAAVIAAGAVSVAAALVRRVGADRSPGLD